MLFEKNKSRWPDEYADEVRPYIKAMNDGHWTADKFNFDSDVKDYYNVLSNEQRGVLQRTLVAIAQIEIRVKEFWALLGQTLQHPSISDLGITMANIEVIHNAAYEKLLAILNLMHLFRDNESAEVLQRRMKYLDKHTERTYKDKRQQFVYSLILFTLFVENVSLFSQFYVILNFNRYTETASGQVLKDTAQQVKYTRNEEQIHAQAGMYLINKLRVEYPELFDADLEAKVREECFEAFQAESGLVDWILQGYEGEKLNSALLKNYVADRLNQSLTGIGYEPLLPVDADMLKETFWMVEGQYAPARVDFFNSESVAYAQADQSDDDEF